MSTQIEQIKEKLSIVDVVSSYIKLERSGIYFKAKCPFHNERTPSFMVSPARNNYHCFGCAKGGDIFSFVQEIEGLDFPATLRMLAEKAGVTLDNKAKKDGGEKAMLYDILESTTKFYESELRKSKVVIDYLKERGIKGETAKTFRIGFAPDGWQNLVQHLRQKGWAENLIEKAGLSINGKSGPYDRFRGRIMFPISSSQGRTVAFTGRVLPGADEQTGKYVNSPETVLYHKSSVLFGLDLAKQTILKEANVIVVEGQMDAIMIHQAGNQNVIAVSGTALTEEHLKLLKRFTDKIIFCFDNDKAGYGALLKATALSISLGLEARAIVLKGKDPADMIKENPDDWVNALKNHELVIDYLIKNISISELSVQEKIKKVRGEVLPLIASLAGNMEQSYFMKKISESFDVPESSVRDDIKKLELQSDNSPPSDIVQTVNRTAKVESAERIIGFEIVFRDKLDLEKIRSGFLEVMKIPIETYSMSLSKDRISSLTLEAELYYAQSDKPDIVAEELLSTLYLVHHEEELSNILRKLRIAEKEGNKDEAIKLLTESRELGEKIYQIKNNRLMTE